MAGEKRMWLEPELIVLGRGMPEEKVLESCKTGSGGEESVNMANDGCMLFTCDGCALLVTS